MKSYLVTTSFRVQVPDDDESTAEEVRDTIADGLELRGYRKPATWEVGQYPSQVRKA